jgi:hypothetical protein
MLPVGAADYYDFLPGGDHQPGDIWCDLPTFGVLARKNVVGLVVTPACDLSNRKVETVTYVPVIPVVDFLTSLSMLPEVKRAIEGQLQAGGIGGLFELPPAFERADAASISAAISVVSERQSAANVSGKEKTALTRAAAGLRLLGALCEGCFGNTSIEDLRLLLGEKAHEEIARRLITNSYRSDLHFLPNDEQRPNWSGVPLHSVALFRYPITLPLEIVDAAQVTSGAQWPEMVSQLAKVHPCANECGVRPMRRLRLRPRFANDLLTRFTAMLNRLGSPDFSPGTVAKFVSEIGGAL